MKSSFKKGLAMILSAILVITVFLPYVGVVEAAATVQGDYNADGVESVEDLVRLKKYLNDNSESIDKTAEHNKDNAIDDKDTEYLRYSLIDNLFESVTDDDGTFEGKKGNISLLAPQNIENAEGQWASNLLFSKETGLEGTEMKVTSNGIHPYDMLYIKFTIPVKAGNTYTVSMNLSAEDTSGTWGWWITNDVTANGGDEKAIQKHSSISAATLFHENGWNFTFTPSSSYKEFYVVLREESTADVTFDFTIDNVKVTTDSVVKDDGRFDGNPGNISVYSPLASAVTSVTYESFNPTAFHYVIGEDGNTLRATAPADNKWDAIFIKFDETIVEGKDYTITYDASWKGAGAGPTAAYGYSIMPTYTNWLAVEDGSNMANFDSSIKWFDGEVSITFTANANLDSWYLVLACQNDDVALDIELDNIMVQQSYLLGLCEATYEVNIEVENTLTNNYVSTVAGTLGVESYRVWMHLNKLLMVDENNNVTLNRGAADTLHQFIDALEEQGVKRFIGMTSTYIYPYGYDASTSGVVPDPTEEAENYQAFLQLLAEGFQVLATEFPEVQYFEPGNEPDVEGGQNLCKNGYTWGGTTEANTEYLYTDEESTRILADMMWYTRQAVQEVNSNNQVLMPALCGYADTPDYLRLIYTAIESGNYPTGQTTKITDPDAYFDILNWHPYLLSASVGVTSMDDEWLQLQKDIYAVAQVHDDDGKPVWFTEMGFTDRGKESKLEEVKTDMINMFNYVKNDLHFIETVFLYRVTDLTGDAATNEFEDNFGLFYSLNNTDETLAGQPKPVAIALYKWLYGEYADLTPLYALADWIEENVTANKVSNDDGTFEGHAGIFSLYTPGLLSGAEGELWATQITFNKVENETGHKLNVISSGDNQIDYLYIKVNHAIEEDTKYRVSMDLEALDDTCKNGKYGYWILSPEATLDTYVQYFKEISSTDLFTQDASFEFVSNGDYDYFYLLLREYNPEATGTDDVKFDFSIDNITFKSTAEETVLNDNGEFEGVTGNISLYSPTVTSEILNTTYNGFNKILYDKWEQSDGTHALRVKSTGTDWDTVFIKFDSPVVKGCEYRVTYGATWNGAQTPTNYGYAIMPNTLNWVAADAGNSTANIVDYDSTVEWFNGEVTITFTSNTNSDSWYLVLVDQNGSVPLDMEIDNIVLENLGFPVLNAVSNDDGTFEGETGNISLYSSTEFDQNKLNATAKWQNNDAKDKISFQRSIIDNDTVLSVKSNSSVSDRWDMVYVKFDAPIYAGKTYTITYDATWTDGVTTPKTGDTGYGIIPDIDDWVDNTEINSNGFTPSVWYDGSQTITFTALSNQTSWYLVLVNQDGTTDLDLTIDNIRVSTKVVLNDDGTFEGNTGDISLLPVHEITGALGAGWANHLNFSPIRRLDGTAISIKTASGQHEWDPVLIKFNKPVEEGKTYTVTMDLDALDDTQNNGTYHYWITDTTATDTGLIYGSGGIEVEPSILLAEAGMTITFTSNKTCDYFYIILAETSAGQSMNVAIDNITFTEQ